MQDKIAKLFTRDNIIWTLGFFGSVILYASAHTKLIPVEYSETAKDIATVLGFITGKLGWSMLPTSDDVRPDGSIRKY